MGPRTIQGTSHSLSFCTSIGFRRDAVMALEEGGAFAWLAPHPSKRPAIRHECATVDDLELRVAPQPFSKDATDHSIWSYLDDAKRRAGFPYRLVVRLPLAPATEPFSLPWPRALACECMVSGLGLGVKIRFAFSPVARESLVEWPGKDTRFALRGPGGGQLWSGTVGDVCVLAARAALEALGGPWTEIDQEGWQEVLGRGVRRVWAEIADRTEAGHTPPSRKLVYGIATQTSGYDEVTRSELYRDIHYRIWGSRARKMSELQFFAPRGAALYLRYAPGQGNMEWRSANCHRRDVVYGLAQHNLLVDQLRTLAREAGDGSTSETMGVTGDKRVGEMARLRLALLHDLQQRYPWARHYSRRQLTAEDLGKLSDEVRTKMGAGLVDAVARQLDASTEPPEPAPDSDDAA